MSGIGTVTLAKYINGEESGWLQIRPEKFYFTSDILEKSGRPENVHKLYNWTPENAYAFIIDIRNWEDDLHVTPKDISYSVKAESRDLHEVTGAVGGIQGTDYTITGGKCQYSGTCDYSSGRADGRDDTACDHRYREGQAQKRNRVYQNVERDI